jgi:benzoyl-CoA reductase/2-hydroxyglutaryl-CoA dehydratase subunit BcrC/BadD/HgdB
MKRFTTLAAVAVISTLATGCASIVTDSTATVNMTTSNGEKTKVNIDGQTFNAPGVAVLYKTGANKIVVADDENCQGQTIIERKVEPAFFGNIITGGFLGSTTDYSTKKMWTYSDQIMINCGG